MGVAPRAAVEKEGGMQKEENTARQLSQLEKDLLAQGGLRERMTRARLEERKSPRGPK
jgi:hypothetical protein